MSVIYTYNPSFFLMQSLVLFPPSLSERKLWLSVLPKSCPWDYGASDFLCVFEAGNKWQSETLAGMSKGLQRNVPLLSEWREAWGMPLMSAEWKSESPGSFLSLCSVRTSPSRRLSQELRSQGAQQLLCSVHKHTPHRSQSTPVGKARGLTHHRRFIYIP